MKANDMSKHRRCISWLVRGVFLIFSCQTNAGWLELCHYPALPPVLDDGYLAHVFDQEQHVLLLSLRAAPSGNSACESKPLSLNASDLVWTGFIGAADSQVKRLGLLGQYQHQAFKVSEIVNIDTTAPAGQALDPPATTVEKNKEADFSRAAWFWSPAIWQQTPKRIFDAQSKFRLQRIYISLEFSGKDIANPEKLCQFLALAHRNSLKVWPVLGDPYAVLEDRRPFFLDLVKAIASFNAAQCKDGFDGLQLDIEPYLLPGYNINPGIWLKKQAETVTAVKQVASALALDMVIPFWLNPEQSEANHLLTAVDADINSLTVMVYRTDLQEIYQFADKFLRWGKQRNKAIFVALESLPIPDQELRVYAQATQGELWQLDFDAAKILLLLKQPLTPSSGEKAYQLSHTRVVEGSKTSFFKNPDALLVSVGAIEAHHGDSPAFAGIALHGLDQ